MSPPLSHVALRLCVSVAAAVMLAPAAQAESTSLTVKAVVVSKSNCKFDSKSLVLDFGTIDPASSTTASTSLNSSVTCNGGKSQIVTLVFTLGAGSYDGASGARRMRHATTFTEFLPYALSITPPGSGTTDKNGKLAFTVTGTILASQFQNVMAGNYTDTVTITVSP